MKLSIILSIIVCISFLPLDNSYASIIRIFEVRYNESRVPNERNAIISCNCSGRIVTAKLTKSALEKIFLKIQSKTLCDKNKTKVCFWLKNCDSCDAEIEQCVETLESGIPNNCTRKTLEMKRNRLISPRQDDRDGLIELQRKAREAPATLACPFPSGLKKSSLSVVKYPSSIQIVQKCIFGHTLPEGIARKMRCEYAEDKWKPTEFEDCRPFIDCTIKMISTGKMSCSTGTINKAPVCNVSCGHYEDKPPVPETTYECQIYGGWKPKLPYCAASGTGIELVRAPKIKLHHADNDESPAKSPKKKLRKMDKMIL